MSPRAEGDYLVGADVPGYLLLGWGLALVVAGFATLPAPTVAAPNHTAPNRASRGSGSPT